MLTMPLSVRDREQHYGKNYMIQFSTDEYAEYEREGGFGHIETWAYNSACLAVLKKHGLSPFHQIGDENKPGYHGWEVWRTTTKEAMESLLPEIEMAAQENIKLW